MELNLIHYGKCNLYLKSLLPLLRNHQGIYSYEAEAFRFQDGAKDKIDSSLHASNLSSEGNNLDSKAAAGPSKINGNRATRLVQPYLTSKEGTL
jgi:hypothetical protein